DDDACSCCASLANSDCALAHHPASAVQSLRKQATACLPISANLAVSADTGLAASSCALLVASFRKRLSLSLHPPMRAIRAAACEWSPAAKRLAARLNVRATGLEGLAMSVSDQNDWLVNACLWT